MGKFFYGPQQRELEIEDRALAHVKIVILSKLRRGESFAMSWENQLAEGSGRGTIWLSPSIPIEFQFFGNRPATLNRAWIQALTTTAERGELRITPEPPEQGDSLSSNTARW